MLALYSYLTDAVHVWRCVLTDWTIDVYYGVQFHLSLAHRNLHTRCRNGGTCMGQNAGLSCAGVESTEIVLPSPWWTLTLRSTGVTGVTCHSSATSLAAVPVHS